MHGTMLHVKLEEDTIELKLCVAYGEVEAKQPLVIIGSHGFLEISANHACMQGNAARKFKVDIGTAVQLSLS